MSLLSLCHVKALLQAVHTLRRYVLLTAMRDKLVVGIVITCIGAMFLSLFLGQTSLSEQLQTTVVLSAGLCRMIFAVGMILFVCFHVQRGFDSKEIEVMLSRPIARSHYLLAYWIGFLTLASFMILPLGALLAFVIKGYYSAILLWTLSLWMEITLVMAFALTCALILQKAIPAILASLSFYFIARILGYMLGMIQVPFMERLKHPSLQGLAETLFSMVSMLLPRLDFFSKTEWLVYGIKDWHVAEYCLLQFVIYTPLLLAVALIDFKRKQF